MTLNQATVEHIIRRAPLGLRFLDLVRGVPVTDGLIVQAWPMGSLSVTGILAERSPLSGVYGFRSLPGLYEYETGALPATFWCASPPEVGEFSPDELESPDRILELFDTEMPATEANFVVSVEDRAGRFLPQTLVLCLPKEHLLEVPLFSSPARPVPPGLGVVRGEIWSQTGAPPGPAGWAFVTASVDPSTVYTTVADARGMFSLFFPYAAALPALQGSPPHGSTESLTWALTIHVFFQPSHQQRILTLPAPSAKSILEQSPAQVYDQLAAAGTPSITRTIRFGEELLVATTGSSRLLVDPI